MQVDGWGRPVWCKICTYFNVKPEGFCTARGESIRASNAARYVNLRTRLAPRVNIDVPHPLAALQGLCYRSNTLGKKTWIT